MEDNKIYDATMENNYEVEDSSNEASGISTATAVVIGGLITAGVIGTVKFIKKLKAKKADKNQSGKSNVVDADYTEVEDEEK